MTTHEVDLHALALKLIFGNFVDCDYRLGNDIVSSVMVIWASIIAGIPFHNYNDRPSFSEKAREQTMLWDILRKWSKQYWAYFKQVEQEKVEKFSKPILDLSSPDAPNRAKSIRSGILKVLETQDTESTIELMAILIVECARQLGAVPYPQTINSNSSSHDLEDDVVSILYLTDISLQLA